MTHVHEQTGLVTSGDMCEGYRPLHVRYITALASSPGLRRDGRQR